MGPFFQFISPELYENVNNDDLSMYSSHSTEFFVSQEVRKFKADSNRVDRFQLDTRVQDMVREMNRAEGFRIIGWFKPAVDDEGTVMEHKNFHIARLEPEKEKTKVCWYRLASGLGELRASSHLSLKCKLKLRKN